MTTKTTSKSSAMILFCSALLLLGSAAADYCEPCVVSQHELEQIQAHRQELHHAVGNLERDLGAEREVVAKMGQSQRELETYVGNLRKDLEIERETSAKLNQVKEEIVLTNDRMKAELETARQKSEACSAGKQQEAEHLQAKLKVEVDENIRVNKVLKETTEHRDCLSQDLQAKERSLVEEKERHEASLRSAELARQDSLKEFEGVKASLEKEIVQVREEESQKQARLEKEIVQIREEESQKQASLEKEIVQIREEGSQKQAGMEKELADLASRLESRISEVVTQNEKLQTVVQNKNEEQEKMKKKFYETRQQLFQANDKLREIEENRQVIAIDVPLFLEKVDKFWTLFKEEASKVLADINQVVGPYLSQLKEVLDTAYDNFMEVAAPMYATFSNNMRTTYVPTAMQMSHDARLKIVDISNDIHELSKPPMKQLQDAWEPHGKTISSAWEPYGAQVEEAYAPFRPMVNSSVRSAREFSSETIGYVGKKAKKYTKIFHMLMIVATQYVVHRLSLACAGGPKMIVEPLRWAHSNFIFVGFCIEVILATMIGLRLLAFVFRLFFPKPKTKEELKKQQRKKRREENKMKFKKA